MGYMFDDCKQFNQPIGNWDVSNVKNMCKMFHNATSFNQELGNWKIIRCNDFSKMFYGCVEFRQSLRTWKMNHRAHKYNMFDLKDICYPDDWKPKGFDDWWIDYPPYEVE